MSGWCGMKEEITSAKRGQVTSKQGIRGDSGNPPFQWSPWIRNNRSRKYTNQSIGGWKEIISIPIYIFQNILLNFYHMCLYYTFHIRTVSTYTFLKEKNLNALAAFYFHEIYPYLCRKFTFSTWATSSFLLFGSQENPNKTCFWIKYKACFQIKSYKNPCIHNI